MEFRVLEYLGHQSGTQLEYLHKHAQTQMRCCKYHKATKYVVCVVAAFSYISSVPVANIYKNDGRI